MEVTQPEFKVFNSLGRKKEKFEINPNHGGKIRWYNCGPTVYDSSHLGHARSYISFDIIRRILQDVFGYQVEYVMNITDIDDKIIKRARQIYLFEKFRTNILKDGTKAFEDIMLQSTEFYGQKLSRETDMDKQAMMQRLMSKCVLSVDGDVKSIEEALNSNRDVLVEYLDHKYGSEVEDNKIFTSLPRKFEDEFFEDMRALNIPRPETVTRVSEFIDQIIEYIEKIVENGYAYESNESVYFDTVRFNAKHKYGKLVPEAVGDQKALEEGEGVLNVDDSKTEKRHPNDFALWKRSKPGEPFWKSPWGPKGRPGWHIECSVMSYKAVGDSLDIHSGGVDLKFPHHENEIAQSDGFFDSDEARIRYWLHTGHLEIEGCKMSKSLKNFVTIRDALKDYTFSQLRLLFLMHSWGETLDYSEATMIEALKFRKTLQEFFSSVEEYLSDLKPKSEMSSNDSELETKFKEAKAQILNHLTDNFNTKDAMKVTAKLVNTVNKYLKDEQSPNSVILEDVRNYVLDLLQKLGAWEKDADLETSDDRKQRKIRYLIKPFLEVLASFRLEMRQIWKNSQLDQIPVAIDTVKSDLEKLGVVLEDEFVDGRLSTLIKTQGKEKFTKDLSLEEAEEAVKPFLKILIRFREESWAIWKNNQSDSIISLSDRIRSDLLELKVELTDVESGKAKMRIFFLDDVEINQRSREESRKIAEKQAKLAEREAKEALKKIHPSQLFIHSTDKYSKFDEKGIPTHDNEGKPITKSQLKKLIKMYEQQEKRYNESMN
ncbi:cysteine--tRNA ligase, cytoplasmic [Brevipalpus obovatus]|uniref:cysteine--tRNA ligase, cytoplasmic n=1 Tax=Brevipalpus obovatus TaxID=246614 RepID=UPI003D9F339C